MNSHSTRKRREVEENTERLELTGLLNIYREGEEFAPEGLRGLQNARFEPVDLEKLRADYRDMGPGRRSSPRYGLRLTVLVCNHQKAFRTQTENVSLAGLLMKDSLPESFHHGYFDVVLIDETQQCSRKYILFRGKVVGTGVPSRRVAFEGVGRDAKEKLYALISDLTPLSLA